MSITTRSGKGAALTHAEMDANLGYLVPAGAVMAFAMNSAPTGWIECSGNAVSRSTYADLFAAIGTTFGTGDGSTTFNLPNLRGEFIRGWDNGRGVDDTRTFGSSQVDALTDHNHTVRSEGQSSDDGDNLRNTDNDNNAPSRTSFTNRVMGVGDFIDDSSTVTATETRPRNIALMYCIKI